jgi:predicted TPR repeat methyltransferase
MPDEASSRILQRVYNAKTTAELAEAYDQWAGDYDAHVTGFGYKSPAVTVGMIGRYVQDRSAPILDAGTGTGLVGELLMVMGHRNLVGIDLSRGMLDKAQLTGAYNELRQMVLGEALDFPDNRFIASQSVGVFTAGHAPATAFDELTRVVAPGGHIVFSLLENVRVENGFEAKFQALADAGRWKLVEKTPTFAAMPYEDPALLHRVFVFQVLSN